jgi:hypothetical protein
VVTGEQPERLHQAHPGRRILLAGQSDQQGGEDVGTARPGRPAPPVQGALGQHPAEAARHDRRDQGIQRVGARRPGHQGPGGMLPEEAARVGEQPGQHVPGRVAVHRAERVHGGDRGQLVGATGRPSERPDGIGTGDRGRGAQVVTQLLDQTRSLPDVPQCRVQRGAHDLTSSPDPSADAPGGTMRR